MTTSPRSRAATSRRWRRCGRRTATEHIAGQVDAVGPSGVREYFTELFAAFPDFALEVRSTVTEGDRSAVHWTAAGTHLGPLWGVEPTGARVSSRASTCCA